MHRSLRVLELVTMISDEIDRQTLSSFGRACKMFRDPALDVLWRHQNTLMNLLRCMPEGIWDESDEEGHWTLNRPVLPADWERPLFYARRVKSFHYDDRFRSPCFPTSPVFLESLRLCFSGPHIFPNIEKLSWFSYHESTFPHVRLFLGPRLKDLGLSILQSTAHLSLLPIIAVECPLLTDVGVECSYELDGQRSVSTLVLGLHRLESLFLPCLDNPAVEHIARLPGLTSLTLENQSALVPFPESFSSDAVLFPCLSSLHITGNDVNAVVPFLTLLTHAPIVELTIDIPDLTPAKHIAECYSAMARHCSQSHISLGKLTIGHGWWGSSTSPTSADIATYHIHTPQFLPLLNFTNLTEVFLTPAVGFDLDDMAVTALAQAWPRLRQLYLFPSVYLNLPSRITLTGLLPFAQHCPHLSRLKLALDASAAPKWAQGHKAGATRVRQNCLRSLDVLRSPINNPLLVAGFLSSVFPKLCSVFTDQDPMRQHPPGALAEHAEAIALHTQWKTVQAALPVLRKARAEERFWTAHDES
ncbi:hypothetical protein GGX14DRAFT_565313 [Mycena pura]|uniref:F-box domain-containing protein n=1 Tax=Mycena pura TaxID=153505 RepID=A0AAD6VIL7_9AGAR|nr:hypothetical protein GGX14DRAFT_565313 [Mycena pura]